MSSFGTPKWLERLAKGCLMTLALVLGSLLLIACVSQESGTIQPRQTIKEWATWDGESEVPNAKVIILTGDLTRYDYGSGKIHGTAYNRTNTKIGYIQISYGIYNENGSKVDSCFVNQNNIDAGITWEFDAPCFSLPSTALKYKVEDVTYF